MEHPTSDQLSELVIDPPSCSDQVKAHVPSCNLCNTEVQALLATAHLLSETESIDWTTPSPSLWAAISEDLDSESEQQVPKRAPQSRKWALSFSRAIQIAAVGLLIGLLGGWVIWGHQPVESPTQPDTTVLASTTLQDKTTRNNRGHAELVRQAGEVRLNIHLQGVPKAEVLSVWLSDPQSGEQVQIGVFDPNSADGSFSVPSTLVEDGFRVISLSKGALRSPTHDPGAKLASGKLAGIASKPKRTKSPTPSPSPSPSPSHADPQPTDRPRPSTTPTASAQPSATATKNPTPQRTQKPTTTPNPALKHFRQKQLRQKVKACRAFLATPKVGSQADRAQRAACRMLLQQWRASRLATPSPQTRILEPDQLQPEVLPQPSQT